MVVFNGTNAIGWTQLVDGNLTSAVVALYDDRTALAGWMVIILYLVFQFLLYVKTRNMTVVFTFGVIFTTFIYLQDTYVLNYASNTLMWLVLVFSFTSMIYSWALK